MEPFRRRVLGESRGSELRIRPYQIPIYAQVMAIEMGWWATDRRGCSSLDIVY